MIPICRKSFKNPKFSHINPFILTYAEPWESKRFRNVINAAKYFKKLSIKFQHRDGPEKRFDHEGKEFKKYEFKTVSKNVPNLLSKSNAILISLVDVKLFQYGISPNKLYDAYALAKPVITLKDYINEEIEQIMLD